ncbi:MAG TPA: SdrD B-like domain-containing protein [Saprospiraceae bacterium]|nr:SdrD B-like domain-containing protein [Saprospiraceae bacterium]HNT18856.1 SdrD B-like domain-containing protein [Saprospiraceae bacterium]
MRTYVLALLLLSCYSHALTAQNCTTTYADSYSNSTNVDNESRSTGAPNGSGATFTDDDSRLTWDMGAGLPTNVQICIVARKGSSGTSAEFNIQYGSNTSSFTTAGSVFEITSTSFASYCVTIPVTFRYIRLVKANNDGTDMQVDAVVATYNCCSAQAGNDQSLCLTGSSVTMGATPLAGGSWTVRSSPANPGSVNITDPSSATTSITGFTSPGTYGFIWIGPDCSDTMLVTASNPPSTAVDGSTTACNNSTTAINLFSLITGENAGGTWSRISGSGGTFNAGAGTYVPNGANAGSTQIFRYIQSATAPCINDTSFATVNVIGCCSGRITGLLFNRVTSGGNDLSITNGGSYDRNVIANNYNLEATVSGTLQSVRFIITGPTGSTVIDNDTPYRSPASAAWNPNAGSYSVQVQAWSADNAGGTMCHDTTISFSLFALGSISGRAWLDANNNGQQNTNEYSMMDIEVILTLPGGGTQSAITDEQGEYSFTGLAAGTYSLEFLLPGDKEATLSNSGSDATDSDIDGSGLISNFTLTAGQNRDYDAGMYAIDCECQGTNLLNNPSFESTGGWTTQSGSFNPRYNNYMMCGSYAAYFQGSSSNSRVYQNVQGIAPGATVTLHGFAGTYAEAANCPPVVRLKFFNAQNGLLQQDEVEISKLILEPDFLQEFFIIGTTAPPNTSYAQVEVAITCHVVKLDGFCLTAEGGGEQQLPIQSLVFNPLEKLNDEIKLSWTTLNELNTDRFEIFRSMDNMQTWVKVSEVPAMGHTTGEHNYVYMDKLDRNLAKISYRINQIDLDGKDQVTPHRTINLKFGQLALEGYPNPTRYLYRLQIQSREEEKLSLVLLDIMGRPVLQENIQVSKGYNMKEITLGSLPAGTYRLRVSGKTSSELITVVKVE